MTADDEVRNIRRTLEKIHKVLYDMNKEFELAVPEVERVSAEFEQTLVDALRQADSVRDTTVDVVSYFPSYGMYLSMLFTLEVIAGLFAIALVCYLIISWNQRYLEHFSQSGIVKNRKMFQRGGKSEEEQAEAFIYCTAPPSLNSSDVLYEKADKEWWNELQNSNHKSLLNAEKV